MWCSWLAISKLEKQTTMKIMKDMKLKQSKLIKKIMDCAIEVHRTFDLYKRIM